MKENKWDEIKEFEEKFERMFTMDTYGILEFAVDSHGFLDYSKDVLIFKGVWYNENKFYHVFELKATNDEKYRLVENFLKKYGDFNVLQRPLTRKRLYKVKVI